MRFNVLVKSIFDKIPFFSYQKIRFYIFSYIGSPKVDMSYSDFLLAEKQIERFWTKPIFSFSASRKVARPESSLLHART